MNNWQPCPRCNATGQVPSPIEPEKSYACHNCGGFGSYPTEPGHYWFIKQAGPGNRLTARIACLEVFDNDLNGRLTIFSPTGPVTHYTGQVNTGYWPLIAEVSGYRHAQTAARILDHWSHQPAWEDGMKWMTWLAYWNLLHPLGASDQLLALGRLPWQDRMRGAARLKAKLAPDEDLFT